MYIVISKNKTHMDKHNKNDNLGKITKMITSLKRIWDKIIKEFNKYIHR